VLAVIEATFAEPETIADDLPRRLGVAGDQHAAGILATTLRRLGRTWFKRLNPIRLQHPAADRFGPLDALDARLFRPPVLKPEEASYGFPADAEALATRLAEALAAEGERLVTAESCTAGLIGAAVAAAPGSSDVFEGGFVTYRTELKTDALGVSAKLLRERTPYHAEVACRMAEGALARAPGATLALAVTGVGGPGPECGKPAGLVYIAAALRDLPPRVEEHRFSGTPRAVLAATVRTALALGIQVARAGRPRPP
jgi:PncC family amidohydrolase